MFRKIIMLGCLAVVFLCSCADKTTPEYAVKEFIDALKNDNEQVIVDLMDLDRILVQVNREGYSGMSDEEKKAETDRLARLMLSALHDGELSVIKDMKPVIVESELKEDSYGPKALVVVADKSGDVRDFAFMLSQVDGRWKIFRIIQKPA